MFLVKRVVHESLKDGLGVRGAKNALDEKIKHQLFQAFENEETDVIITDNMTNKSVSKRKEKDNTI